MTNEETEAWLAISKEAAKIINPASSLPPIDLANALQAMTEIVAREINAPGYALAIVRGIAAYLSHIHPDLPDTLKRELASTPDART
jgi:hypothetical protein